MVLVLLLVVAVIAWFVARARRVDDEVARSWAARHGVRLSAANAPMVTWYLRTSRVLRVLGVVAGLVLPPLVGQAAGLSRELRAPSWTWVFAGYLVAALYAEIALVRRAPDGPRVASLHRRRLDDYLPRRLVVSQRLVGALAVAASVAAAAVPYRSFPPSGPAIGFGIVAAVLVTVGLEAVERWLVRRPQPFQALELVAADDAIRSQSLHSVAGSGLAVLLLLLATAAFHLANADVQVLRWTMWVPGLAGWPAAIFACNHYGHRPWPVPHRELVVA